VAHPPWPRWRGRTVEATCIAWCRSIGVTSRGWLSWITPSGPTFLARKSWRGSLADLSASMADDTFDPELYLIAEDTTTGSYDGLIRVWNRAPLPRLGCLGVRARWRRTRLPIALISAAATVLAQRGVAHVITETDAANSGSCVMAARRGTTVGAMTEWERSGPSDQRPRAGYTSDEALLWWRHLNRAVARAAPDRRPHATQRQESHQPSAGPRASVRVSHGPSRQCCLTAPFSGRAGLGDAQLVTRSAPLSPLAARSDATPARGGTRLRRTSRYSGHACMHACVPARHGMDDQ